jgi:signal peptidase I
LTSALRRLWKSSIFRTVLMVVVILLVVLVFWLGSQAALNTGYPALAVKSGSMCTLQDGACDGWSHPFAQTLHIGDLIIVQGVNPADLNADYPNSDIIVYHQPSDPDELIVHRIVAKTQINGTLYFSTEGDGNGAKKWPDESDLVDLWSPISQDLVVGKVVMRIPWVGHLVLFMRESPYGVPTIIILAAMLIIIEFVVPEIRRKKPFQKTQS